MLCAEIAAAAKSRENTGRRSGFARTRTVLREIENQKPRRKERPAEAARGLEQRGQGRRKRKREQGLGRRAKEKRKCLTWRKKGEILCGLEVSYVPSSSPFGFDS